MVFDLVTTVEGIERKPNGKHEVEVSIDNDALMPVSVQKLRARGRALVSTGVVEAAGSRASDIASAIENLSVDEIQLSTEVKNVQMKNSKRVVTVVVN
jgi:hypothetical protein